MVALMMIGSSTSQMDDLDLTVLSRKARYALFPDSSTMGVCIYEYLYNFPRDITLCYQVTYEVTK